MKKSIRQLFFHQMLGYAANTMLFVYMGAAHVNPGFWGTLSLAVGVPALIYFAWDSRRFDNDGLA